jgi:integrase/recombinase XerD
MNPHLLLNGSRLRNRDKKKKRDNGEAIDIYNFEQKLKNAYSVLERASFEKGDKELIRAFADHLRAIGVSNKRLSKYIFHLKVIGENFPGGVSFKDAKRKDIELFMSWLRQQGYTAQTIADYIMVLKRFYKFVTFGNVDWDTPYPEEVRWLRKTIKANDLRQPEILSAKEIESMMKASSKLRDKTMLSVGYEAGLRATELLGMNMYDVSFDGKGAKIRVRGKTGERTVRLISSAPLLARYFEEMIPTNGGRNGENRALWTSQSLNYRGRRLTWQSWSRILKQLAKDAGLGNRRIYNHLLRHSSATANAGFLTESELKLLYGWSGSSKMPAVYVHLHGKDLDQKLQAIYSGRQVEVQKPEFTPIICARCSEKNTPGFRFCSRCGTPLGQSELVQSSLEMESLKQKIKEMESLIQSSMSRQSVSSPSQGSQVTPLPLSGAAES